MNLTRRNLAAAGAFAFGAASFLASAPASAAEDDAITQAVEALRKATLGQDKAKLEALLAPQLSYSHSSGVVQNMAEMIDGVMTRKGTVKSIEFPELKVAVVGDAAISRHLWVSDSELDGKATHTRIGVLEVWQKQAGAWKVLARQGYKLE
jgi:Domain of unknown function (DUF4440)